MDKKENDIQCIGFIMDGNRRYAKERNLPSLEGHLKGSDVFFDSVRFVQNAGIKNAVYYAFSTENWKRSDAEVGYLLDLFRQQLQKESLKNEPVNVRFVGNRSDFPPDIIAGMNEMEKANQPNHKNTLWIALSYGGRAEIVAAVNEAILAGEKVDEETFANLLWSAEMPDPDMIVRTGGDCRLSNFLTWKSVYSELLFLDKLWPELKEADFREMINEYKNRKRRFGK